MNKPLTIVMIEDDPGHARLVERNIKRAGITNEIVHFADGAAARAYFERIKSHPTDSTPLLILLDLNLPDISGTALLGYLKKDSSLKLAPVIVLTTTDDEAEIKKCYDLGCNVYITKPVDYDQFADSIRQIGLFFSVIKVPDPVNA